MSNANYYFTSVNFRSLAKNTNYRIMFDGSQGGGTVNSEDFHIDKYVYGFRAYTTESKYEKWIINVIIS